MDLRAVMIGGIVPAVMFGIVAILVKLSMRAGISVPMHILVVGIAVSMCGLMALLVTGDRMIGMVSGGYALAMGAVWAIAIMCLSYGISELKLPVAMAVPLNNSNALFTVILSAFLFSEWKELDMPRVIFGAVLILVGVTVISTGSK